ncbi:MAG: TerC family protein [Candidatus Aminicenantaceae bacterium]
MEWITQPQAWVALATLTALEIVLGIDNIVFISVLVGRVPKERRNKARTFGLALAMVTRILLLLTLTWIMKLTTPVFTVFQNAISGRDIILLAGGLFLLAKSTHEIHQSLEGEPESVSKKLAGSFTSVLIQIALLDIVFSLDSVITAVGLADHIPVMILAIVIAVAIMMLSARVIGNFVDNHPTIKMLAMAFLLLVGFSLMGEGLNLHIPKGYIYFAMAFSLGVEILNLRLRERSQKPVKLHKQMEK